MIYQSVAEILDLLEQTRSSLYPRVEGLSEAQANFRLADDRWTIGEIVEHLSIVEGQILKLTNRLLAQAEEQGLPEIAGGRINPVSLAPVLGRWEEKFQAPERSRPQGGVPIAESIARLRQTRAAMRELRPRLEARDLSQVNFPHPAFGPLDAYQWLALVGLHEARHQQQIEALMAAPGYPGE
jgi:hypothetical protein